jgi:hypothetical protein
MHLPVEEQVDAVTQTLRDHVGPDCNLAADATVFVTEFSEAVPESGGDSMKSWLEKCDRSVGAVPDPSVFLG